MKNLSLRNKINFLIVVAVSVFACENSLFADDLLLVRVNGSILTGDFDGRSNETQLVLIKKTPQIMMKTTHNWDEFQSLNYRGKKVSKADLLKLTAALKLTNTKRDKQTESVQFWFPPEIPFANQPPRFHFHARQPHRSTRLAAFNFEAHVANWDRDAELDGFLVTLYPVNSQGEIVPVDGQLEMRLIGQKRRELDWFGRNNREKFPELEQWTIQIRKADFGPRGAVVKLQFRKIRPELHPELATASLLTGTLGVAGQGRFDATAVDVFLRPFSRFRDEHELRSPSRSRVHPGENYLRP